MQTLTVNQILLGLRAHKTCSRKQLYHYFGELEIQPVGARQRPQRYEATALDKVLNYLGLNGSPLPAAQTATPTTARNGIVSMPALRKARKLAGKARGK